MSPRLPIGLSLLAALGCTSGRGEGLGAAEVCEPLELGPGEVRVKRIACDDEVPYTGDGREGDYLLQNDRLGVIIRTPGESLTMVGLAGGTLLDMVPLDEYDIFLEGVPLVEGGWMVPHTLEHGVDSRGAWLMLAGTSAPIPWVGGVEGAPVEITYRLAPDTWRLEIEGTDALYVHPRHVGEPVGSGFSRYAQRMITGGEITRDFGGAVVIEGIDGVILAQADDAHGEAWPDGPRASGGCEGEYVEVWAGGEVVTRLEPTFDGRLPPETDALVCVAPGFNPGEPTPPGEGLALTPGAVGWLAVRVEDHRGEALPAVVSWSGVAASGDLGEGRRAVPPRGGVVPIPPGAWDVRVEHGPVVDPWEGAVRIPPGGEALELLLPRRIDEDGWIILSLFREVWPSYRSRLISPTDLDLAAGEGVTYAVQGAPNEVVDPWLEEEWTDRAIRLDGGSWTETEDAGVIWSWPWSDNRRKSGHGAVKYQGFSPEDVLALASDGLAPYRHTVVGAEWLAAAGPPHQWEPSPESVRLRGLDDLPLVLDLLAAGRLPGVVGPLTWSPAVNDTLPGEAACERGLYMGWTSASSGPLLALAAGEPAWFGEWVYPFALRLQANREAALEAVDLYVDGEVVQTWPVEGAGLLLEVEVNHPGARWAMAVARSEEAGWAVSAPLLLVGGDDVPQ